LAISLLYYFASSDKTPSLTDKLADGAKGHIKYYAIAAFMLGFIFYILGISLPFFKSTSFYIFEDSVSLLSAIELLFVEDEIFLGSILFIFTIVAPMAQLGVSVFAIFKEYNVSTTLLKILYYSGKWAMLDVFFAAVIIIYVRANTSLVEISKGTGLVFFSLFIIFSLLMHIFVPINKHIVHHKNY
jgi:uncharacterized paraquat-inducible protein A